MAYKDVHIPDNKDPDEYSYQQRRAEILRFIIEAGHPDHLSRTQFAERYDVNPSTITRDIQTLEKTIRDELGTDAEFVSKTIYEKALRELTKEDEWMKAVEVVESYNDWLFDMGVKERASTSVDAEITVDNSEYETDDYAVLPDDAEIDAAEIATLPAADEADEDDS